MAGSAIAPGDLAVSPESGTRRAALASKLLRVFDGPSAMYAIAPLLLLAAAALLVWLHPAESITVRVSETSARIVKEGVPLALLAVAASLVLTTSSVDISTAGVATAGGITFAALSQQVTFLPLAAAGAIVVGAISGLAVGWGVHRNLPALILSWAVGSLWLVLGLIVADSRVVASTTASVALGFRPADDLFRFGEQGFLVAIGTVATAVTAIALTNLPRRAMAVGANRDSAVYAGIRTRNVYLAVYALSGALSASAGILSSLVTGGAQTTEYVGRELAAIAIAILGGTVMTGGYLFLPSVVAAAFFWTALDTLVRGTNLTVFQEYQSHAANGLFAFLFVLILLPLGKRLAGSTQTVMVEQRTRES